MSARKGVTNRVKPRWSGVRRRFGFVSTLGLSLLILGNSGAVADSAHFHLARALGIGKVIFETRVTLKPLRQTRPLWSWAAVTAMIVEHSGRPAVSQCSLLRSYYQVNCCAEPERCKIALDMESLQKHLNREGISVKPMHGRQWRPMAFQNHIEKTGKPIVAKIKPRDPKSSTGSFILITGVIQTDQGVTIYEFYDPVRGLSPLPTGDTLEAKDLGLLLDGPTVLMVE